VLQLDAHPDAKLLDVERRSVPLDSDLLAEPPRLICRE
jgi:hypothetical protein